MFDISEILDLAIRIEKNGESAYRGAIRSSAYQELASMLKWMAEEEAKHGQWFKDLKTDLDKGIRAPFLEEMGRQMFDSLLGSQSFSLKEVDFAQVTELDELLSIFIEFEQDTVLFYEMMMPFIEDGGTRAHLQTIIDEENQHIAHLHQFLKKDEKKPVDVQ